MRVNTKYHAKKFNVYTDLENIKCSENKWLLDMMIKKEFYSLEEFCEFAEVPKYVIKEYLRGDRKTLDIPIQDKIAEALDVDGLVIMKNVAKHEL